jgi:hypothetical protein
MIANPLQGRAIAHAEVKADKVDAAVLAKIQARGFSPKIWMPDGATETLRRLVALSGRSVDDANQEPDPWRAAYQLDFAALAIALVAGRGRH